MPATQFLMVGGEGAFVPAQGCPVAMEKYSGGEYFPHNGNQDKFLAAELQVHDGSAAIWLALWRCEHCGVTVVGLGNTKDEITSAQMTWFEEKTT
jgi:hypothetical protein